jgi:hypothetical protein
VKEPLAVRGIPNATQVVKATTRKLVSDYLTGCAEGNAVGEGDDLTFRVPRVPLGRDEVPECDHDSGSDNGDDDWARRHVVLLNQCAGVGLSLRNQDT